MPKTWTGVTFQISSIYQVHIVMPVKETFSSTQEVSLLSGIPQVLLGALPFPVQVYKEVYV